MKISDIDNNFSVKTEIDKPDIRFLNVDVAPFRIYGIFRENGLYRRLPKEVADSVNDGVKSLSTHTAGGRVTFETDSPYVAISAKMPGIGRMPHFALSGSAGFDMYVEEEGKLKFFATFLPDYKFSGGYESVKDFGSAKPRKILINFPTYSSVSELNIGLAENSNVSEFMPYDENKLPVVFYGSSITQGGCCSRPGNAYQQVLSRKLGFDYINLGFSGSARGEQVMAEYIAGLPMSVFVCDYDHNAPNAEHLMKTHKPFFDVIRENNPELPIIFVTRPDYSADVYDRMEVIRKTYDSAVASGDKNVYFVSGMDMFGFLDPDMMTVDGTHPNDFGFYCMAEVLGKTLKNLI